MRSETGSDGSKEAWVHFSAHKYKPSGHEAICNLPLEALCQNLEEAEERRDNICCQFGSALTRKQSDGLMASQYRQPCAGGMLHHLDVNTEQVLTAPDSFFIKLSYASTPAVSYLSSVQNDLPVSSSLVYHFEDSFNACLSFRKKSVDPFKDDTTVGCSHMHVTSMYILMIYCESSAKEKCRQCWIGVVWQPFVTHLRSNLLLYYGNSCTAILDPAFFTLVALFGSHWSSMLKWIQSELKWNKSKTMVKTIYIPYYIQYVLYINCQIVFQFDIQASNIVCFFVLTGNYKRRMPTVELWLNCLFYSPVFTSSPHCLSFLH